MSVTESRKRSHIDICLREAVEARNKRAGFQDVDFVHLALPELDLNEIDASTELFGKRLSAPIIIEGMTGGYREGGRINKAIAEVVQEEGIAMGLGSQRAMLEDPGLTHTYEVRDLAPDALIIGNIGIPQLKEYGVESVLKSMEDVRVDAIAVHLNALQEVVQKEGERNFTNGLSIIEELCKSSPFPVIAKETGAGIDGDTAEKLVNVGVKAIDVGGAGGTSWSAVELLRGGKEELEAFWDWGIPTVVSIVWISRKVNVPVIASGGVRSGMDVAKSIALGGRVAGAALPFLRAYGKWGKDGLKIVIDRWKEELKAAMFLTGSRNIRALGKAKLFLTGTTADMLCTLGCYPNQFLQR